MDVIDHVTPTHLRIAIHRMYAFAQDPDPLVETSNWVALVIGTHLPFWPLYVWWSAGAQSLPSAFLTAALTPIFLLIPLVSRRNGLLGRMAMLTAGIANTVWTLWILGENTGTALFLAPCAALAAILFRRQERWLMLIFTTLPLAVWYLVHQHPPAPLHRYEGEVATQIFYLNAISISVLITCFGWFQANIYGKMEQG